MSRPQRRNKSPVEGKLELMLRLADDTSLQ